jgi:hypothetical protein
MGMTPIRLQAMTNVLEYQARAEYWARRASEERDRKALGLADVYQVVSSKSAASARRAMGLQDEPWA